MIFRQQRLPLATAGVCLTLLLCGCGGGAARSVEWQPEKIDRAWPQPPQEAKISFLRTVTPADFLPEKRSAGRLVEWLTGEKKRFFPFVAPYGIASDGAGRIWVADPGLQAVHCFDLARKDLEYFAVVEGEPLDKPVDVVWDAQRERLYLSDSVRKEVFVLDVEGNLLASRTPPDGYGRPAGLALDGDGRLHVVDVVKGQIHVFASDGTYLDGFAPVDDEGEPLNRPSNIAVSSVGTLHVVDSLNFRVVAVDRNGRYLYSLGRLGDVPGTFARPRGVAVDKSGHIYVADAAFDNIQVFDSERNLLIYFGEPGDEAGQFTLPAGLSVDEKDRLYVVDSYNQRIQIFQLHTRQDK